MSKMHADYAGAAMPGEERTLVLQARADILRARSAVTCMHRALTRVRAAIDAVFHEMTPAEQIRLIRASKCRRNRFVAPSHHPQGPCHSFCIQHRQEVWVDGIGDFR